MSETTPDLAENTIASLRRFIDADSRCYGCGRLTSEHPRVPDCGGPYLQCNLRTDEIRALLALVDDLTAAVDREREAHRSATAVWAQAVGERDRRLAGLTRQLTRATEERDELYAANGTLVDAWGRQQVRADQWRDSALSAERRLLELTRQRDRLDLALDSIEAVIADATPNENAPGDGMSADQPTSVEEPDEAEKRTRMLLAQPGFKQAMEADAADAPVQTVEEIRAELGLVPGLAALAARWEADAARGREEAKSGDDIAGPVWLEGAARELRAALGGVNDEF